MKKHIHILGASGSGTSTLAEALCRRLGYRHLDTDDYYWLPTDPPFTEKRSVDERIILLEQDMKESGNWILSGSNCGWGDIFIDLYDLVIFLYVPEKIRLERLKQREAERYGSGRISPGGDFYEQHKAFMDWAAEYDTADMGVRSLALHNDWLRLIKCPVLRIEGGQSLNERITIALQAIIGCGGCNNHEMRLLPEPFDEIRRGAKTVEVRLNDEKRRKISAGDTITFYRLPHGEDALTVKVLELHHCRTFEELYRGLPFKDFGCEGYTMRRMLDETYLIYTPEQERLYGVLGIKIELLI